MDADWEGIVRKQVCDFKIKVNCSVPLDLGFGIIILLVACLCFAILIERRNFGQNVGHFSTVGYILGVVPYPTYGRHRIPPTAAFVSPQ